MQYVEGFGWGRISGNRFIRANTTNGKTPTIPTFPPEADYFAAQRMWAGSGGRISEKEFYYGWKECERLGIRYVSKPLGDPYTRSAIFAAVGEYE